MRFEGVALRFANLQPSLLISLLAWNQLKSRKSAEGVYSAGAGALSSLPSQMPADPYVLQVPSAIRHSAIPVLFSSVVKQLTRFDVTLFDYWLRPKGGLDPYYCLLLASTSSAADTTCETETDPDDESKSACGVCVNKVLLISTYRFQKGDHKLSFMASLASRVAGLSARALGSSLAVGCWAQKEQERTVRCDATARSPASSLEHSMQEIAGNQTIDAMDGKKMDDYDDGDSFPNLTRHGANSLLKKHLTPEVYEQLRHKQTSSGVKLEDLIQGGIALPWGARPPRGIAGVYAGDAGACVFECDDVFVRCHLSLTLLHKRSFS